MSQKSEPMTNDESELQRKPAYKKPKTSPFLDLKNITSGDQTLVESNDGTGLLS
ncbi:MAG: hypothetical protein NXI01_08725 [Gammaproteobacteria bacterium]|nr:hypothetical protein [Gammaproteobacteria bacterium]